ncbi:MAG TPA: GNAT family N-acetyltransferase, partial [Chromatiales bacterium]|nr:GNAT family N-acetyltransferase [Chromatiales bacterium]
EWLALEPDWRRLEALLEQRVPFMTWEWQEPWRRHFAADKDLMVFVCRQDAVVVAILPFIVERCRRRKTELRTLKLVGSGLSDQLCLLVDPAVPEAVDSIVDELAARSTEWDIIELDDIDSEEPSARRYHQAFDRRGLRIEKTVTSVRPYLETSGQDWASFYTRQRSSRTRKRKRNQLRRLQALGTLEVRTVTDPDDYLAGLDRIIALNERGSYHGQERHRPFDGEAGRGFFREMGVAFARNSWLLMWLTELDGRLIAYELGLRYQGRHFDYYGGFDSDYFKSSAGSLLKMRSLQACFEDGVRAVDFLRGSHEWKKQWTDDCRTNVRLTIANPSLSSRFRCFVQGY